MIEHEDYAERLLVLLEDVSIIHLDMNDGRRLSVTPEFVKFVISPDAIRWAKKNKSD